MGSITTVGEFLDDGTGLGIHCLDCHRYAELNLQACGSRKIQTTVIAAGTRSKGRPISPY